MDDLIKNCYVGEGGSTIFCIFNHG